MSQALERFLASPAAIVLAVAIALCWGFWSTPLYDLDEGAFTEATREMIETGNYTSIYLNGEPRQDKPILIYWLQAASVHIFGLNEFSLRLPSVLAGFAWVFALFAFARRHTDKATAGVAALLLALSLYVGLIAKAAVADALLNLFLVLAMFDIYSYFRQPSQKLLLRVFVWLGLGFLTKGPVAVFFPFIVSGLFYLSYGRWREWLKVVFNPLGLVIFIAIVLPWHIAVYLDSGWAFFKGFYLNHNINRYSGSGMEGHGGSAFYYVIVAPLIVMPFAGWFLASLSRLGRVLEQPLDRFIWIWFFSVLIVFSFSGTKLPHYLLYGMTGVLLLMAMYRESLQNRWLSFIPVVGFLALLSALPQILSYLTTQTKRVYDISMFEIGAEAFTGWPQLILIMGLILSVVIIFIPLRIWQKLLLQGFIQAVLVAFIVLPVVMGTLQNGPKAAALFAKEQGKDLVYYRAYQPSVSVYREQVIHHEKAKPGQWVYVRVDHVDSFLAEPSPYKKEVVFSHQPANLIAVEERSE